MCKDKNLAGAPMIEVTPEMVEAGLLAFYKFDPRYEAEEDAVKRIFTEMELRRREPKGVRLLGRA